LWVESCGPKHCITSASFECTAQRESFPRPNPHRMCGSILHICSHLKLGVWGWEWEIACTLPTSHTIFPKLPSTYHTNFDPKTTIRTGIILAIQWCAQVVCMVDAKLCLEKPIWPRLPKKGVTQWWGRPMISHPSSRMHQSNIKGFLV